MHARQTAIGLTLVVLGIAAAPQARAQLAKAAVDLQVFRPAADTKGYITLNGAQILAPLDVSFGIVTTGGWKPLVLDHGTQTYNGQPQSNSLTMKFLLTTTLQGAVGLFSTDHLGLQFGLALPIGITNGEGLPYDQGAANGVLYVNSAGVRQNGTNDDIHSMMNNQGVGDLALLPKLRILNPSRGPVGISIIPGLILPTGDKSKFLGEGQTIFQPQGVVEVNWGRYGVFRTALNLGMRIRTGGTSQFVDNQASFNRPVRTLTNGVPQDGTSVGGENTNMGISVGNEFLAGAGASWGVVPFIFDLVGEVYTFTGLNSKKINADGSQSNMGPGGEAVLGFKAYLAPNSFFTAGGGYGVLPTAYGTTKGRFFAGIVFEPGAGDRDGDGLKDDVDKCPDDPEDFDNFEDEDGCPDLDNDKDGIPDKLDLCPNDPEDKDGFEDEDGCPDPDNDHDRILDVNDKCPNEPETYNGFEDEDGCPDKGMVIVQRGKLEILDKIYFETDKDVIMDRSLPLIDAIAATIKGHPEIALIEIQGHADERGDDEHNLDLTDRRAHSVMRALEDRGVELGRLRARGYGETRPVCTQHNEDCWSKNRRVEFIIIKRVDEAVLQNDAGQ